MNGPLTRDEALPLALERHIESVCASFEADWRRAATPDLRPRLEEYLGDTPEPTHTVLLHELIRLDVYYHRCAGEDCRPEDYQKRFPGLATDWEAGAFPTRPVLPGAAVGPLPAAVGTGPAAPGYEILGVLGRGGMGVVYKARQVRLNRVVALKMILSAHHASEPQLARFRAEAEAVARLQHPNIVQIHEVGEQDGHPYLALEYVGGGTLADWTAGRPQPPRAAGLFVETLALAIDHAHQRGVVHRDLKPANILLVSGGVVSGEGSQGQALATHHSLLTTHQPKITDFGLAKQLDAESSATGSGIMVGTPGYMAPEQAAGRANTVGPAVDVHALGLILYELLTGRLPFVGATVLDTLEQVRSHEPTSPSRLQPKLPRDLVTICLKCLRKDPNQRYAGARALADDLRRFLEGRTIQARPTGAGERAVKWARRHPAVATLLAAVVLVTALGFAGVALQWRRAEQNAVDLARERDHAMASYRLAREALGEVMELQGEPRFQEGELEDVRRYLLRAEAKFYEKFLALRGEDPAFRRERAEARFRLAFATAELGSAKEGLENHQQAFEAFDALVADFPEEPEYARRLADSLNGKGVLHFELGHGPEALAAFRRAQGLLEQLTSRSPSHRPDEFNLAMTHHNLGRLHLEEGRRQAAEADYVKARTIYHRLAEQQPNDPKYQLELAQTWYRLGVLYQMDHRPDEAMKAQAQALPILERLVRDHPNVSAYEAVLARATQALAWLQQESGQRRQAIAIQRQALDRFRRLAEQHPRTKSYLSGWAEAAGFLGTFCHNNGDYAEAEKYHREAATRYEQLPKIDPSFEIDVARLGGMYCNVGHSLLARARFEEALNWYEKAASALEPDAARPRPQRYTREFLIKTCGGRALELLQRARAAGFFKETARSNLLKTDKHLEPLRSRADFQEFLAK